MAANIENLLEEISNLTLAEAAELKKLMEEKFGVTAAAPVMVGAAAPAAAAEAAEEKTDFNVELTEVGANKLNVIKAVREITGLGLKVAKDIADNGGVVKEKVSTDEANEMKAKFEEAGATIELK